MVRKKFYILQNYLFNKEIQISPFRKNNWILDIVFIFFKNYLFNKEIYIFQIYIHDKQIQIPPFHKNNWILDTVL